MQSYNLLWEKSLNYLEKTMHLMDYQAFIKDLKPLFLQDGTIFFEVSNDYHRQIMTEKYEADITEAVNIAFNEIYGEPDIPITLAFLIPSETEKLPGEKSNITIKTEEKTNAPTIRLNPAYTFESFVVGESNRLANAMARSVAEEPGRTYNPLFLYGGVGLGKTHLMHAIGNEILAKNPNANIIYVTSDTFLNELIRMISLSNNNSNIDTRQQFQNKYRTADVLMIDDIQFIAGKEKTQDEFFFTFNALYDLKKQIIITSDRPVMELEKLNDRIRSRFEWGMVADITAPDYETRVAILMKKAQMHNMGKIPPIDNEVYHFIASQENTNIRTLEGWLNRVLVFSEHYKNELKSDKIDINTAKRALENIIPSSKNKEITLKTVSDAVCKYYKIDEKDIKSIKKSRDIAFPRQIAMYLMRSLTDFSLAKIADYFEKDHTTIMYAVKQVKKMMEKDARLKTDIEEITVKIKG